MITLYSLGKTQLETEKLQLGDAQLSVNSLCDIYAGLDPESCRPRAIQVHGLHQNETTDMLQLFFENKRSCGGGEIEDLDYDAEEGVAVIIYKDADSEYTEDLYWHLSNNY